MTGNKRFSATRKKNPVSKEMGNYIQDNGTTILKLSSLEDCKDVVDVLNEFDCEFKHFQERVISLIEDELKKHPYLTLTEKWNPNCENYHSCRCNHEKNVFYASRHTLLKKLMDELDYD